MGSHHITNHRAVMIAPVEIIVVILPLPRLTGSRLDALLKGPIGDAMYLVLKFATFDVYKVCLFWIIYIIL